MRITNAFKTTILVGIGVGIGIGYLAFDAGMRAQLHKSYRKGLKMAKRQGAEVRDSAQELVERGGKELKDVGRRIYREVAG